MLNRSIHYTHIHTYVYKCAYIVRDGGKWGDTCYAIAVSIVSTGISRHSSCCSINQSPQWVCVCECEASISITANEMTIDSFADKCGNSCSCPLKLQSIENRARSSLNTRTLFTLIRRRSLQGGEACGGNCGQFSMFCFHA